ncbi:GatB/YqeY domain-containing protein [Aequorivita marina]|uniref:GatB/YqeY domain-containing protein n=1 Tax=Aequorivita marina TaxID=3073654 RepID=UPI0028756646|nr:GatB/YqeY domain-containing protein [Aequorivita sp. S2608]MDS1296945.1 GatB/YqeY domain-containing protein [Aequorivita sp. S2608]
MGLQEKVMEAMKAAMKAKDTQSLEALRSVKSALLLAQTEAASKDGLSEKEALKLLQKQVKQRKDSAAIYTQQNRPDLAEPELIQAKVIEQFLPKQLSTDEVSKLVEEIIAETGASSMADMGKVMGLASAKVAGRADGKTISSVVKEKLS